jgi:hypothetical protein
LLLALLAGFSITLLQYFMIFFDFAFGVVAVVALVIDDGAPCYDNLLFPLQYY